MLTYIELNPRQNPRYIFSFVITEVYALKVGRKDQSEQAQNWKDIEDWNNWLGKCNVTWAETKIKRSLW